jgi:hypothetical protein
LRIAPIMQATISRQPSAGMRWFYLKLIFCVVQ